MARQWIGLCLALAGCSAAPNDGAVIRTLKAGNRTYAVGFPERSSHDQMLALAKDLCGQSYCTIHGFIGNAPPSSFDDLIAEERREVFAFQQDASAKVRKVEFHESVTERR